MALEAKLQPQRAALLKAPAVGVCAQEGLKCIYVGWPGTGETAPFSTDLGKKANRLWGGLHVCPLFLSEWHKVLWR